MTIRRYSMLVAILFIVFLSQFALARNSFGVAAKSDCNMATFVADVTVPDGSAFKPGNIFTKTWRLKNTGSCTWTTAYSLVFIQGEKMGAPASVLLPVNVTPAETVELSISMQAPSQPGHYRGYWQIKSADGNLFGLGGSARDSFWVDINVTNDANIGYDFAANACTAVWRSGAGVLPCPGAYGDARGFAVRFDNPRLEDGTVDTFPGLLVFPENKFNGYIQGTYPEITVKSGSRFQGTVGCDYGSSCYVTFRLDYQVDSGTLKTFWTWSEKNEGHYYLVDKDLSSLTGKKVKFTLTLLAAGFATGDRAIWGQPRITASGVGLTVTPLGQTPATPSKTPTPSAIIQPATSVPPIGVAYNFAANLCAATWHSGAGDLPCPNNSIDSRGYAVKIDRPRLEDNTLDSWPGILLVPQEKYDGYIQGTYPEFTVEQGDHFWGNVGCEYGKSCYVTFRLDYQVDNGPQQIFWKWSEKNEGHTYTVDKDLSFLAGKKVKFTLTLLAAGPMINDFAIWAHPMIVRTGTGPSLTPTCTATVTATPPTPFLMCTPPICLAGTGALTCGNPNGCPGGCGTICGTYTPTPTPVIMCTAPACSAGSGLTCGNLDGCPGSCGLICALFTPTPTTTPSPTITITPPYEPPGTFYDFGVNACAASWKSGAGALPCPGTDGDSRGFVLPLSNPHYENGATDRSPSLILFPQNKYDGYIQGTYPEISIQAGDRFQGIVNCAYGSSCYVTFRLEYQIGNSPQTIFWTWKEKNEGLFYRVDKDLSVLAGKKVKFTLTILATGFATGDRALWAQPRLIRSGGYASRTPTQTATPVPPKVTSASIEVAKPFSIACGGLNPIDVFGSITTNSPMNVTYHWELGGDKTDVSAGQTLSFNAPGTIPLHAGAYLLDCGSYTARLVVTSPNYYSALIYFTVAQTNALVSSTPTRTPIISCTAPACSAGALTCGNPNGCPGGCGTICITFTPTVTATGTPTLTISPTPTVTATQAALIGPYAVILVAGNDVLNVRSGPGTSYGIVSSFAWNARDIWRTGAKSGDWVEVQRPGGTGWVNSYYLTELISSATFCADSRVNTLLASLGTAINNSNGNAMAALVSGKHGVDISMNTHGNGIHFSPAAVTTLFTGSTSYDWSPAEGVGGGESTGTFKDIVLPYLLEVFTTSAVSGCNDDSLPAGLGQSWPYGSPVNFYSLRTPAIMPWRMFMAGIEYVEGKPYLLKLIHARWSP